MASGRRSPSGNLDSLREAIRTLHRAYPTWVESVPVKETFEGETAWEGTVQVFDLEGHPEATRCTRLTNGFSKKLENLEAAVALHFAHYNFVRRHRTLGTTPAVAAGVADRAWSVAELVHLVG